MNVEEQVEKWKWLQALVETKTAELTEARAALREHVTNHLREHPLSEAARESLRGAVLEGKPLCCEAGMALLKGIVDPIWADHINDWAYEALGCRAQTDGVFTDLHQKDHLRRLNEFFSRALS